MCLLTHPETCLLDDEDGDEKDDMLRITCSACSADRDEVEIHVAVVLFVLGFFCFVPWIFGATCFLKVLRPRTRARSTRPDTECPPACRLEVGKRECLLRSPPSQQPCSCLEVPSFSRIGMHSADESGSAPAAVSEAAAAARSPDRAASSRASRPCLACAHVPWGGACVRSAPHSTG